MGPITILYFIDEKTEVQRGEAACPVFPVIRKIAMTFTHVVLIFVKKKCEQISD